MSIRKAALAAAAAVALTAATAGSAAAVSLPGKLTPATSGLGLWVKVGTKTYKTTSVVSTSTSGSSTVTVYKTSDPAGRRITATLGTASGGVQSLSAAVTAGAAPTSIGIDFKTAKGEQWFGFGERADAIVRGGAAGAGTVENFTSDGPWQPTEWAGIGRTIPAQGFRGRMDATYFPIPWTLSTKGYGVLIDKNETSRFSFGGKTAKTWSVEVDGAGLALRVFYAGSAKATLGLYTQVTGRQPAAAAPFYFGPWFQGWGDATAAIQSLKDAGSPTSLGMTYSHYLPCGVSAAGQIARAKLWHDAGMAVTTYFNPMVCTSYTDAYGPAAAASALAKKSDGTPYIYTYLASQLFTVGQYDFTNPAGVSQFQGLLASAVSHGYDGWMEDFGEYTPLDAHATDGTTGSAMHNIYPRLYHKAASDYAATAGKPLARFQRSGWSGSAPYAQVVWGGDPSTGWGYDGIQSVIRSGLGMGLSGYSLWGSDIGGYFSVSSAVPALSDELLSRWIEVGFASGVMRNETDGLAGAGKPLTRPQVNDASHIATWSKYSKLRTQLYPYLSAAEKNYDQTGVPLMRSLLLDYPTDSKAATLDDQYLFGPDLLAAPVITQGATTRKLYLPKGDWIDFWKSARLNPTSGGLEATGSTVLAGAKTATVDAPLDQLPLFVKAGAALPLISPDVWTLADYGSDVVHLSDRQTSRRIVAFPRGSWSGALGVGETMTSTEGTNSWSLAISGSRSRSYGISASLGTLNTPFTPGCVKVGGTALPTSAWSYNATSKVLSITATLTTGTIAVSKNC